MDNGFITIFYQGSVTVAGVHEVVNDALIAQTTAELRRSLSVKTLMGILILLFKVGSIYKSGNGDGVVSNTASLHGSMTVNVRESVRSGCPTTLLTSITVYTPALAANKSAPITMLPPVIEFGESTSQEAAGVVVITAMTPHACDIAVCVNGART